MQCPACGSQVNAGDTFCPNCGASLSSSPRAPAPVENTTSVSPARRTKVYLVIALVLVAAIAGGVYVAYGRGSRGGGGGTVPPPVSLTVTSSTTPVVTSTTGEEPIGSDTTITASILPQSQGVEGGGTYSKDPSHGVMMLYQYLLTGNGNAEYFAGFVNIGTVTVQSIDVTVGTILNDSITTPVPQGEFAWGPGYGADFGYTGTSDIGSGPYPVSLTVTYADGQTDHYSAGSINAEAENPSAAGSSLLSLNPPEHTYLGALKNGSGDIAINLEVDTNETFGLTAVLTGNGQTITVPLRPISATYGLSDWNSCEACIVEGSTTAPIQGLKVGDVYTLTILSQYSYFGQGSGESLSPTTAWPVGLVRVAPYNSSALEWPLTSVATTTCDTNINRCGV